MLEEFIHVHAVNHAGFLNGLAAGRGAAQAVHADGQENGRGLGSHVQDVTGLVAYLICALVIPQEP